MKWLIAALVLAGVASSAAAQVDGGPKVHARLISESATVPPGGTVTVAFEQVIRSGWHTYWINPGDVGQTTVGPTARGEPLPLAIRWWGQAW